VSRARRYDERSSCRKRIRSHFLHCPHVSRAYRSSPVRGADRPSWVAIEAWNRFQPPLQPGGMHFSISTSRMTQSGWVAPRVSVFAFPSSDRCQGSGSAPNHDCENSGQSRLFSGACSVTVRCSCWRGRNRIVAGTQADVGAR